MSIPSVCSKFAEAFLLTAALLTLGPFTFAQSTTNSPQSPGSNASSSTGQFQGSTQYAERFSGATGDAQIKSAISAAVNGGIVDARGIIAPFNWESTVTIEKPLTLYLPCTRMKFTAQILAVTGDDVHIKTCGNGGYGQTGNGVGPANSATQFVASGISSSTNAIVVQKTSGRNNDVSSRISGFTLDPLYINMNSLGNRAIYTTSCIGCVIDHPIVDNANCGTEPRGGPDGAISIEADLDSPNHASISYFGKIDTPLINIADGNSTCHGLFFDARHGEISLWRVNNLQIAGCGTCARGAGSDQVYVLTAVGVYNAVFDNAIFENGDLQNAVSGAYGFKFEAPGNFLSGSGGGRIGTVILIGEHVERINQAGGNIGIGCTGNNRANGVGCGAITLISPAVNNFTGGFYGDGIDQANLGVSLTILNDQSHASGISYIPVPTTTVANVGNLLTCNPKIESAHAVANNCNATCSAGGTCRSGGSTHCEVYCNGTSWIETGR